MWKRGLIWLSKPSRTFLAKNWSKNEAQNGQEGPVRVIFQVFKQNSYSVPLTVWKNGLIWLSKPSRTFLAFLDLNWPKIRSKTAKNDPRSQISIFLSKIHAQYLRLCGKVALFGSLSLLEHFWQKIGPKMRPKMSREDL